MSYCALYLPRLEYIYPSSAHALPKGSMASYIIANAMCETAFVNISTYCTPLICLRAQVPFLKQPLSRCYLLVLYSVVVLFVLAFRSSVFTAFYYPSSRSLYYCISVHVYYYKEIRRDTLSSELHFRNRAQVRALVDIKKDAGQQEQLYQC